MDENEFCSSGKGARIAEKREEAMSGNQVFAEEAFGDFVINTLSARLAMDAAVKMVQNNKLARAVYNTYSQGKEEPDAAAADFYMGINGTFKKKYIRPANELYVFIRHAMSRARAAGENLSVIVQNVKNAKDVEGFEEAAQEYAELLTLLKNYFGNFPSDQAVERLRGANRR